MKKEKLEKYKKQLLKGNSIDESEEVVDVVNTSYVKKSALGFGKWVQGWAYYTDKQLVIPTNLGLGHIHVKYKNIEAIDTCSQFFMPLGIVITYHDEKENTSTVLRISTKKRAKYIAFLVEKSGIKCA